MRTGDRLLSTALDGAGTVAGDSRKQALICLAKLNEVEIRLDHYR